MTAMDQAFFKAYSQAPPAAPVLLHEVVGGPPPTADLVRPDTEPTDAEPVPSSTSTSGATSPTGVDAVVATLEQSPDAAGSEPGGTGPPPPGAALRGGNPATMLAIDALGIPGLSRSQEAAAEGAADEGDVDSAADEAMAPVVEGTSAEEPHDGDEPLPTAVGADCARASGGGDTNGGGPSDTGEQPWGFRPLLQVDRFAQPCACAQLTAAAADELDCITAAVAAAADGGQQVLAVAGTRRGVGCSTLVVLLAQRLGRAGRRTAVLEADPTEPRLSRRLGVLVEAGWEAAAAGRLPLAEVAVESLDDRWALLPSCPEGSGCADPADVAADLRRGFDVVLVDWGPATDRSLKGEWIDAVLVVDDARGLPAANGAPAGADAESLLGAIEEGGVRVLGTVANFVRD